MYTSHIVQKSLLVRTSSVVWGHNEAMVPSIMHALLKIGLCIISMHAYAIHYAMVEAWGGISALEWPGPWLSLHGQHRPSAKFNRPTMVALLCGGGSSNDGIAVW